LNDAEVAELADAQDLGSCGREAVGVQLPPSAPRDGDERTVSNETRFGEVSCPSYKPGDSLWPCSGTPRCCGLRLQCAADDPEGNRRAIHLAKSSHAASS